VPLSENAVILVLLSAIVHVGWNTLLKSSDNPRTFALLKGTLLFLGAAIASPWIPFHAIPSDLWPFVIASGVIHTGYIISLSTAYETGDISFVYPIARSSPALVPFAAYWLIGEQISPQGALGIGMVVLCILALQKRPNVGRSGLRDILRRKDLVWALLTLSTVVGYTIVDKAGMVRFAEANEIDPVWRGPIYFVLENALCYALFWLYMFVKGLPNIRVTFRTEGVSIAAAALGTILSYSLILYVLQTEAVSYVVTLRQSSVFMAVVAGTIFFKEGQPVYRITIAIILLAGFYLVSTA
jgi:drug/metabolite transporter (DMT)-like permease